MSFTRWLRNLQSFCRLSTSTRKGRSAALPRRAKRVGLKLEALEDRCLLSFGMPVTYLEFANTVGSDVEAVQSLVSGDFNGDGRLDLVTGNHDEQTVSVLLGNGDGTFQTARISGAFYPTTLLAGDLNGDGNDDLLTYNNYPNNISMLLSNGDGTFQSPQTISLPAQQAVSAVALGDYNNDGNLDIVAPGQYVNILLGNGDGTFLPVATLGSGAAPYRILPGDFNNDGLLDILYVGGVFPGNGDGTVQAPVSSNVNLFGASNPVGDFNGDGKLDLLSDSHGPYLQLGNGNGTFQEGQWLDPYAWADSAVAGDVNADGKLDIVLIQSETHEVLIQGENEAYYDLITTSSARVLLGYGDGSFAAITSGLGGTTAGALVFISPVLADFNGDGFPDLAATEYESGWEVPGYAYRGVQVALNDGAWTLPPPPPPPPPTINIGNVTVSEGNTGTRTATFTVTLSAASSQPVTAEFATADGAATAGSDYQAQSGTLTFAPGETSKTIIVQVIGDRLAEPDEFFFVNLSGTLNATIADGQGAGIIVDDKLRFSISDVTRVEGSSGTSVFRFPVTLSAIYDQDVTVFFQTFDGTAKAGSDYQAQSGTITFKAGQTVAYIDVLVYGDTTYEPDETFYVQLSDASDSAWIEDDLALGFIYNDDAAPTKPGNNKGGKKK